MSELNRLRIVNILKNNNLCVCEIEIILGMSQSNVSKHLSKLSEANIIIFSKKAQWIYYRLNKALFSSNGFLKNFPFGELLNEKIFKEDVKSLKDFKENGFECLNIDKEIEAGKHDQ